MHKNLWQNLVGLFLEMSMTTKMTTALFQFCIIRSALKTSFTNPNASQMNIK